MCVWGVVTCHRQETGSELELVSWKDVLPLKHTLTHTSQTELTNFLPDLSWCPPVVLFWVLGVSVRQHRPRTMWFYQVDKPTRLSFALLWLWKMWFHFRTSSVLRSGTSLPGMFRNGFGAVRCGELDVVDPANEYGLTGASVENKHVPSISAVLRGLLCFSKENYFCVITVSCGFSTKLNWNEPSCRHRCRFSTLWTQTKKRVFNSSGARFATNK